MGKAVQMRAADSGKEGAWAALHDAEQQFRIEIRHVASVQNALASRVWASNTMARSTSAPVRP